MLRTLISAALAGLAAAVLVPLALAIWIIATVPGATAESIGNDAGLPLRAGLAVAAVVLLIRLRHIGRVRSA
ncbi:MAG: hypothetical protein DIU54_004765 [Acidobacteriota bacterium]